MVVSGTGAARSDSVGWHWEPGPIPGSTPAETLDRARGTGVTSSFPSQAEAEAWLGEAWPELVELGIGEVSLFEGDRRVYGPMGLSPR